VKQELLKGNYIVLPPNKMAAREVYQTASRCCMITILFSKEVVQD